MMFIDRGNLAKGETADLKYKKYFKVQKNFKVLQSGSKYVEVAQSIKKYFKLR
jgi:hypothetical protein